MAPRETISEERCEKNKPATSRKWARPIYMPQISERGNMAAQQDSRDLSSSLERWNREDD